MTNPERITSSQNPRLKEVLRLRKRRHRDRRQSILIDGSREVCRAIEAGVDIQELYVTDAFWQATETAGWRTSLDSNVRVSLVSADLLDRIAYGDRNEGVVAVAVPPATSLSGLSLPPDPLVLILEGVEKPGNVGAVVRTADAAGIDAVIVVDAGTDLFNPNAIRASLGTLFSMAICAADLDEIQPWLAERALQVIVTRVDGADWYDQFDYCRGTAIVLGSEADGVTECWKSAAYQAAKLPMLGIADSLNVSATAAVLCYEANRQRRALKP